MKIARIEIVPARTKGVTGYVSVARRTPFGNIHRIGELCTYIRDGVWTPSMVHTAETAVDAFQHQFNAKKGSYWITMHEKLAKLLERETPDGILRIACPCNGTFKGKPCHATVIKDFLEALIREQAR